MTDLKTALREILPMLHLKAKPKSGAKWAIDRPVEFHECNRCGEMVDQRIVDFCMITCSDDFASYLAKEYNTWCKIHSAAEVISRSKECQPCPKCYRWAFLTSRRSLCYSCCTSPWSVTPPPMIRKRGWYIEPKFKPTGPKVEV